MLIWVTCPSCHVKSNMGDDVYTDVCIWIYHLTPPHIFEYTACNITTATSWLLSHFHVDHTAAPASLCCRCCCHCCRRLRSYAAAAFVNVWHCCCSFHQRAMLLLLTLPLQTQSSNNVPAFINWTLSPPINATLPSLLPPPSTRHFHFYTQHYASINATLPPPPLIQSHCCITQSAALQLHLSMQCYIKGSWMYKTKNRASLQLSQSPSLSSIDVLVYPPMETPWPHRLQTLGDIRCDWSS